MELINGVDDERIEKSSLSEKSWGGRKPGSDLDSDPCAFDIDPCAFDIDPCVFDIDPWAFDIDPCAFDIDPSSVICLFSKMQKVEWYEKPNLFILLFIHSFMREWLRKWSRVSEEIPYVSTCTCIYM